MTSLTGSWGFAPDCSVRNSSHDGRQGRRRRSKATAEHGQRCAALSQCGELPGFAPRPPPWAFALRRAAAMWSGRVPGGRVALALDRLAPCHYSRCSNKDTTQSDHVGPDVMMAQQAGAIGNGTGA